MQAREIKFLDFLKKSPQFIIPIYQRTYSWTEEECSQLWEDIIRTGKSAESDIHFVGSIVYIEGGLYQVADQSKLLVIDGQQRLTTVTLIIEALARRLGDDELIPGVTARNLRHRYLLDITEQGDNRFKLLLSETDKETLLALVQQEEHLPDNESLCITENFDFFKEQIEELGDDLDVLYQGLKKLVIVDLSLDRIQDNPQLIFESMNSTGRELSEADLIRNFILMELEPDHQTRLYEEHWRPMETAFGQKAYSSQFDKFMRHYLTLKTGTIPKKDAVYKEFKIYARNRNIDKLVKDIHTFARYYCAMALDKETDKELAKAFRDLHELKADVTYPLMLRLYDYYNNGSIKHEEFEKAVRLIESYVFRRAVCAIPTNSMNKTFATFGRTLTWHEGVQYLETFNARLLRLPSYRRFPTDEEFKREIITRDLYNSLRRSYWLRRIENHGRKEPVPVNEYTIEHILPQNKRLSREWKEELGSEWERIRNDWLHTLGNLTLTGYNAKYSDKPFAQKRDMEEVGFKYSPLKLNKGLGSLEKWDEKAIKNRASRLARMAIDVWPMPSGTIIEYEQSLPPDKQDKIESFMSESEFEQDVIPAISDSKSPEEIVAALREARQIVNEFQEGLLEKDGYTKATFTRQKAEINEEYDLEFYITSKRKQWRGELAKYIGKMFACCCCIYLYPPDDQTDSYLITFIGFQPDNLAAMAATLAAIDAFSELANAPKVIAKLKEAARENGDTWTDATQARYIDDKLWDMVNDLEQEFSEKIPGQDEEIQETKYKLARDAAAVILEEYEVVREEEEDEDDADEGEDDE